MNQPFLYVGRDADKLSEHLGGEIKIIYPHAPTMKQLITKSEPIHTFVPNYIKLSEYWKKLAKPTEAELTIRAMQVDDVPSVFDIERDSFNDSSWTIDAFYHELNENNFAKYFVIVFENEIIGYLGLWMVIDQAQITTIAIRKDFRGYGLGQLLLKYVMDYASHSCEVMSLEVRIDNVIAQHVYTNLGFQFGGKRKNYYGESEDAMVMWVNLNE